MENNKAFNEVIEILNHTDVGITKKISQKFIKFLIENRDKEYKVNINFYDEKWEESILEDTKAILALIYRDYIVSPSEREKLLEEENKKYSVDNLFEKKSASDIFAETSDNMKLVEVKKCPWYKKILDKILKLFGRKR